MKKLIIVLATALVATTGMALVNYNDSVHWTGTGDWTNTSNWTETDTIDESTNGVVNWVIPGWVVGNPANTNSVTDLDWNGGYAHIDSGTIDITDAGKADGTVAKMYVGTDAGNSTVNISSDLTVRENVYMGYQSTVSDVATISQTAGNVVLGVGDASRIYLGRGLGESVYNLSGGSLATEGAYTRFGNNYNDADDGASTFTFNQTGGIYTDTGTGALVLADVAGDSTTIVDISGGTFNANAVGSTRIGDHGTATLTVQGTGDFQSSSTYLGVGYYAGSDGTVNLKDTATFTVQDDFYVGRSGTGILNQSGGTLVANDYVRLGYYTSGSGTINLSSGSFSVPSKSFHIGQTGSGVINQSGGTLIAGDYMRLAHAATSSGTVNLSDGSLTVSGAALYVGYEGVGLMNQSGGSVDVVQLRMAELAGSTGLYSISGGSLLIDTYIKGGSSGAGVFEVDGSGATSIVMDSATFYKDTFRVNLDADGATLVEAVDGASTGINLQLGFVEVDTLGDFDGVVGETYDVMWSAAGFNTADMTFTNLSSDATFSWAIVAGAGGEYLRLTVLTATSQYDLWAADYDLTGGAADDDDGDGLSNLYEFGVGGDPTNSADQGISSSYAMVEDAGTNWMTYVYPERLDSGLTYYLELTDDLIYGTWTNAGYAVTGTGSIDADFDAVTNQIPTEIKDEQFIRLIIEE